MSRDPLGEFGGLNLHLFCRNSPTISVDAFGLLDEEYEEFTGHPKDWAGEGLGGFYKFLYDLGCDYENQKGNVQKCPKEKCPSGPYRFKMDYDEVFRIVTTL